MKPRTAKRREKAPTNHHRYSGSPVRIQSHTCKMVDIEKIQRKVDPRFIMYSASRIDPKTMCGGIRNSKRSANETRRNAGKIVISRSTHLGAIFFK